MSEKQAGTLLVCLAHFVSPIAYICSGNYDVTKLHYDGPGDVPGATGGGYGYDARINHV